MITIEQKVHVTADRKISLVLPPDVPEGDMDIVVVLSPDSVLGQIEAGPERKTLLDFLGVLKQSRNFTGNPVEIQRRIRDEWNHRVPA